jgi:hypothetical protein
MAAEREQPDDVTELIDLLERYKVAVADLSRLRRGTPEHAEQLVVEESLSRQIHDVVARQRRTVPE